MNADLSVPAPQRDPSTEDSWVRFYFDDADPVAECACGWHTHGDSASDAFGAWWKHRREHDDAAGEQRPVVLSARVDLDLDAIEARANAATAGSWGLSSSEATMNDRSSYRFGPRSQPPVFLASQMRFADAEFIAHAREDVPRLVAEVRRLRERTCQHIEAGELNAISDLRVERDAARAEAERQRERADHNAAAVNENADMIVELRAKITAVETLRRLWQNSRDSYERWAGDELAEALKVPIAQGAFDALKETPPWLACGTTGEQP